MKLVLISIGTRGDMEPFLAIGEMLKEKGHQVICAFPEQFRNLVDDSSLEFSSLGSDFIDMLDSDVGKAAMGGSGSGLKKFFALIKLGKLSTEINKDLVISQHNLVEKENPDRIVYNGKAIYPIIWEVNNKKKTILLSPVPYLHYVKNHTHVAFNSNYGTILNKLTYLLANFGLVITAQISIRWLKLQRKITRRQIKNVISSNKVIYTISPSLFLKPDYWNKYIKILGYQERNTIVNWRPERKLKDFLKKHERILLITFGSMTNPQPEEKTQIFIDILERNGIPAIINTASGGLVKPDRNDPDIIYFVSRIPYDWIFPKIYGVIHHGGSGTTHLALKYGCATLIIPHIIDQFVWNKIISKMGAGPKGIKIGKITTGTLEPKILELVNNHSYKKKAAQIAIQIGKENFREEIYNTIIEN
jgi:UDP:flavonoid glycosyltransferase YjiC (YdhE family)